MKLIFLSDWRDIISKKIKFQKRKREEFSGRFLKWLMIYKPLYRKSTMISFEFYFFWKNTTNFEPYLLFFDFQWYKNNKKNKSIPDRELKSLCFNINTIFVVRNFKNNNDSIVIIELYSPPEALNTSLYNLTNDVPIHYNKSVPYHINFVLNPDNLMLPL